MQVVQRKDQGLFEEELCCRQEEDKVFPVMVMFDAANAPVLKKKNLKFKSDVLVAHVQAMLKEKLKLDSLVLIVEKCFMPTPDQDLGTLYRNFGRNGTLYITYGVQAVFG